jgi:hypothetical protein
VAHAHARRADSDTPQRRQHLQAVQSKVLHGTVHLTGARPQTADLPHLQGQKVAPACCQTSNETATSLPASDLHACRISYLVPPSSWHHSHL